ncbi:trypsin-like peptidase domain-containing protein [Neolewinella lacunae]|uniref:Trypsin-like peptidase domain-containing protein n=1 Tax=Neolewinella lacunae TaxID=1517758 RepID=A0A923PLF3_9BACT|nr:trypsin-like peptidase domain-containing protein [Neolewinella lacunae]MBC6993454.1 trypsin-like peptidase domain-containing protein [Neolewinella lacunae]MDN3636270.1 trypsin-like peptidase domain-containing protein [Neolewinella lacunae]
MKSYNLLILFTCCLLSALSALALQRLLLAPAAAPTSAHAAQETTSPLNRTTATDFITAAERVTPAVVFLRCYAGRHQIGRSTTGSGVVIDPSGLIATNRHVVHGAKSIRVLLGDKREYDAVVIGEDESTDLALLQIVEEVELPSVAFGNSDSLRVGEWVLAIGNPFSLNSTVTAGIVSAKGRSIDVLEPEDRIESFIQTDAAINPGNSGGPLINTHGKLVGINTAILTNSGRHEGFAFAIPGNLVLRVLNDLRAFGEVRRAVLGLYIQSLNDAQAKKLGMGQAEGVLITGVKPGGSAEAAGLKAGDVLLALNEVPINSAPSMQEALSRFRPGQKIRITFYRAGQRQSVLALLLDKANGVPKLVNAVEE